MNRLLRHRRSISTPSMQAVAIARLRLRVIADDCAESARRPSPLRNEGENRSHSQYSAWRTMRIDSHQHVFWHWRNDADLIADMDAHGIDLAWLLTWEVTPAEMQPQWI